MKRAVVALFAASAPGYSAAPAFGQDDQARFVEVAARYVIEHDDLGKLGAAPAVDLEDGLPRPVGLVDRQPGPPDQLRSHAATAAQSLGFQLAELEDVIDCPERKRYEGPFECRLQGPVKAVVEVSMPEADSGGFLVWVSTWRTGGEARPQLARERGY